MSMHLKQIRCEKLKANITEISVLKAEAEAEGAGEASEETIVLTPDQSEMQKSLTTEEAIAATVEVAEEAGAVIEIGKETEMTEISEYDIIILGEEQLRHP